MDVLAGMLLLLLGAVTVMTATGNPDKKMVETLYNTSGTIHAPLDPTGTNGYKPNVRHMWILDMQQSDVNIEVTVEEVDLGMPYTSIHEEGTMVNYTTGDFILIGAGPDVLQGKEIMFFGSTQTARKVLVRSGVGHIYFYSNKNVTDAQGFTITYTIADMATTTPPPTTASPTTPTFSSAEISIKGIPVNNWFLYNNTFRRAISNMASDYLHDDLNMTSVDVPPSDVIINDAKTCHPTFCPVDRCVSYDFSVTTMRDEEIVFDEEDLDGMLADPSANQYITDAFGSGCQICDEDASISVVLYVVVPLAVIIFGIVITVGAWKVSNRYIVSHNQDKYEQAQKERIEDQRRRSSGDISILGVGGRSLASQGSRSSRRFTMPFPKPSRNEEAMDADDEEPEDEVDTTGFIYYDPDQGITDPAQYGLGGVVSEFTRNGQGSHQYINKAFVVDEDTAVALQRSSFADDSDTDSENGGALSFRPKRKEMTPRNQFEVPADVHNADEGETAL